MFFKTLYTLTSVCKFSLLFSVHFLGCRKGEFVSNQVTAFSVGDYFLYSHVFNPLHPNISMKILHTVLYTSTEVLTRRIFLPIKRFLPW